MDGQIIGYARTSTAEQVAGLEAQVRMLEGVGCASVYREQVSGVDAKRPQLQAAISYLRRGDVFVVTKPDRLARSTKDLLDIVDGLQAKGVTVRILSMDLDTSTPTGKLTLTILGAVATFEREIMLERQRDGIAKAKAEGRYRGRAPTARAQATEIARLKAEGVGATEIAKRLGIGRESVYRILKQANATG